MPQAADSRRQKSAALSKGRHGRRGQAEGAVQLARGEQATVGDGPGPVDPEADLSVDGSLERWLVGLSRCLRGRFTPLDRDAKRRPCWIQRLAEANGVRQVAGAHAFPGLRASKSPPSEKKENGISGL